MSIFSFAKFGYEGSLINVEVDLRRGIPAVDIVGLADAAVAETRGRVRTAIRNQGLEFPSERVLISLSPADLRKDTPMDVAIALGILQSNYSGPDVLVVGELELSGVLRPVTGINAASHTAFSSGIKHIICPKTSVAEAYIEGACVYGVENLHDAYTVLGALQVSDLSTLALYRYKVDVDVTANKEIINGVMFPKIPEGEITFDTANEKGLEALTVAVTGHHHLLFTGAPGCGKTLLAQSSMWLTPCNTIEEAQSVTRIHSLAGLLNPKTNIKIDKPFRMPYQTATIEGVCGGGPNCRPGEISLAHNGILLLDEAAEFRSSVLQMLRVPLESHQITLSRAGRSTSYPAHFQLMLTTNPCPCGNYGNDKKICLCSARSIDQYWKKFSAPLLDRIGIRVNIDASDEKIEFNVDALREIVARGTVAQRKRGFYNEDATPMQIQELLGNCTEYIRNYIDRISEKNMFSDRRRVELIKLSQTIADMWYDSGIVADAVDMAAKMMNLGIDTFVD